MCEVTKDLTNYLPVVENCIWKNYIPTLYFALSLSSCLRGYVMANSILFWSKL